MCQRIYLDEQRELYVICQTQTKDGTKQLVVRSPMQITNNLQIPIEVQLTQPPVAARSMLHRQGLLEFQMVVKPEASLIIPLKACDFDSVQIRPLVTKQARTEHLYKQGETHQFEWSQKAKISLLHDEREIFEQKPLVLSSKMSRNNRIVDRNNNQVFFVLNSNTYSIRSFIDFNTQQTEFISLRYLSVTAPFTIQNLIPAPITMLFKDILREVDVPEHTEMQASHTVKDKQLYDLELKHNSSLQVLYLNPLGTFDFSLAIPGFQHSNYVPFRLETDEDFELCQDLYQSNYVDAGFPGRPQEEEDHPEDADQPENTVQEGIYSSLLQKAQFRFVKQKKLLLQLCSRFQSQFNICANIAFVQGFYHISFYSKYWLLNNTQMPLQARVRQPTFSFPSLELPFQSLDFDFETAKHFKSQGDFSGHTKGKQLEESKEEMIDTRNRRGSDETLQTFDPGDTTYRESRKEISETESQHSGFNYRKLKKQVFGGMGSSEDSQATNLLRLKPWESYRAQDSDSKGLLAALSQEDIDRVSSIYFTQELIKEESKESETGGYLTARDQSSSQNTGGFRFGQRGNSSNDSTSDKKRQRVQFEIIDTPGKLSTSNLMNKAEKRTMMSKTSIQLTNFTQLLQEQQAFPLLNTPLSNFELYEAPLQDKDQLKRVILFSDTPTEDQTSSEQEILLKVCDSEWSSRSFDLTKLQQEPIQIKDGRYEPGRPQAMFELVSVVTFLPSPFSFSKLICFQPRFMMVNRTCQTVYVVQAQCEELGSFKIFPQETSIFHWTDASKPLEIAVCIDDHEFSGNLRIDGIGEVNLRLKSTSDRESTILNVSISEETNSFYIVFTDVSFAPPYRVENQTKTRFKIAQVSARTDDFDRLNPYQTVPFAWSYPLQPKLLQISICQLSSEETLGTFSIDVISKTERIPLKDRRGKEFILEIMSDKTMKVVRIIYASMVNEEPKDRRHLNNVFEEQVQMTKIKLVIQRLGLSIVNSQAREIQYTTFSNLRFSHESTSKHKKVSFKAGDFQIDNQLLRQNDAIILKREQRFRNTGDFLSLKFHFVKNEAIENLLYYKYFILNIIPFELNLDGNFCDEMYKYLLDVFQLATKFSSSAARAKLTEDANALLNGETAFKQSQLVTDEMDQMKSAIDELKKKGQPYMETSRDVQKIYFEQFQINEVRLKFTFSSSPILFREFTMNPTLKFFIVLLSNLKNVQLKFGKFQMQNQHMLLSIFYAQINRFYWKECCNHAQLFKIVSSMGLFGNISDTLSNLSYAFKTLVSRPFYHNENKLKALVVGSLIFVKDSVSALSSSVVGVFDTFKQGVTFILSNMMVEESGDMVVDKDLFEDDIEQASRSINNFSTPVTAIDTQNRIWLKILTREKQNYDVKKRLLRKQKEVLGESGTSSGAVNLVQRRTNDSKNILYSVAVVTAKGVIYVPKKIFEASTNIFNTLIKDDMRSSNQVQKVRPPRFVSFTMELEPYSKKKAFALEILNEINLNVFEAETIQKLYTMSQHVVIITGKRIICVDEQRYRGQAQSQSPQPQTAFKTIVTKSGQSVFYHHWNVFFKDIFKVTIDIVDQDNLVLTQQELAQVLAKENQGDELPAETPREQEKHLQKINFVLKIHYSMQDESYKSQQEVKGRQRQAGGLLDGLSGFQIGRRDIVARMKDLKMIKKIHRSLQQKLK